jgi:hypothetical protein
VIYRKVALEHAAIGAEVLDHEVDRLLPDTGQVCRRGMVLAALPIEAVHRHPDAADLHHDVRASSDRLHRVPPAGERGAPVGVATDPERAAEVIDDEGQVRHSAGRLDQLG